MNSLEIERLLLERGFSIVDENTHAVGLKHAELPGQTLYLKDGRKLLADPRKAVERQPLVLHPNRADIAGVAAVRVQSRSPNTKYLNDNLSDFPKSAEGRRYGVAIDIPDPAALDELLRVLGLATVENSNAENDIRKATDLPVDPTERDAVIAARRGQGRFRAQLIQRWKVCAVTGCTHHALLRASHIKPWRDSNNKERLSPDNGLLLSAHLDAAFDRGLISFSDKGGILIDTTRLSPSDALAVGINPGMALRSIEPEHRDYLAIHRSLHGFA